MMPVGYWLMLGSLLSFAAMGIVHKLGDRLNCSSLHIALFTMLFSCCITTVLTSVRSAHSVAATPGIVIAIAVPFGISAAVALWFFQKGLRYGRIATSWLLINLSSTVPTVLSVVVYKEPLSARKLFTLVLVCVSLLLLWWDRKQHRAGHESPADATPIVAGPGIE
jgi:EamA domain-containing membrane protein RarD